MNSTLLCVVQVTTKVVDQVALTGTVKNELDSTGATDTGGLSLEATPFHKDKTLANVKIKAGIQSTLAPTGVSNTSSASIELPPLPVAQTKITAGLSRKSDPTRTQTVAQLDASARPNKFLELNGGARIRDAYLANSTPDPNTVNTYNLKVLFGPSKLIKLTGNIAANPENTDGTIRRAISHGIGLESDFKLFKFSGLYGYEQEYMSSKLTNSLVLGFDLRFGAKDTLTTGWEGKSLFDSVLNETSIYRLGFTHRLSSGLDLSLSGSMTQTAVNGISAATGPDLKAEAKIGLHF